MTIAAAQLRADLAQALLSARTPDEMERLLVDLTTPQELHALAERWQVAKLLDEGRPYRDVGAATGVSTTTVTRVARFLRQEPHGGYRLALDRTKQSA